jgi:MoxR-like ATPase
MQEKNVTISGKPYRLEEPFFVLATQNPIEQEGTYPLPEAQLDRFMFNIVVGYPSIQEEIEIVKRTTGHHEAELKPVVTKDELLAYQALIRRAPVPDNVISYAVNLVNKTRVNAPDAPDFIKNWVTWGAGPRASQNLIMGAKANALLRGDFSPNIEDVKSVAISVLQHRIVPSFTAEADGITAGEIVKKLL